MATQYRSQTTLLRQGALPEDSVVNTMHWEGDGSGRVDWDADAAELATRIKTFYESISIYLGRQLGGEITIDLYDMSDPKPRPPRYTLTGTVASIGSSMLPAEAACCLSFQAVQLPGVLQRRRRGRIYLGPLSQAAGSSTGTPPDLRISNPFMDTALDAAAIMAHGPAGNPRLAVFSPTDAGSDDTDPDAWNDVTNFWLDNAFDTIRKRGAAPTVRGTRVPT